VHCLVIAVVLGALTSLIVVLEGVAPGLR
jgi:hypothetical protein